MIIKVLGPGCKNCQALEHNVKVALDQMGESHTVEKVTDYEVMASYGLMKTPGLVINEQLVSAGKLLSPIDIIKIISTNQLS